MKHIFLFLLSLVAVNYVLPQAGTLDASFARNGVAYTDFGATTNINSDICQQMLLKNDGSFFLVFEMNEQTMVTHRLADGALDKTYGNNGYSQPVPIRRPSALLQPDGKIVVGGYNMVYEGSAFVVARFNTDGSVDHSFAGNGVVRVVLTGADYLNDLAIQPDGKIVAVGRSYTQTGSLGSMARLNPDGTLDDGFGNSGGRLLSPVASIFNAVAVQPDGKIVVAGDASQAMVARFLPDGNLDNSFSGDGVAIVPMAGTSNSAKTVVVEPGGKIAVGGYEAWAGIRNFLVAQLLPDGSFDASFSADGKQETDFGTDEYVTAITVQPGGKLVAVGSTSSGSQASFAVARYNTDGSLDNSFSGDGKETTLVGGTADFAFDVAVQTDKGILVAGWSVIGNGADYSVVRYLADGSLDPSFADKGKLLDYKP
ncbi:MAG: Ig-like domain-containing protein, partial [Flavisolibacter sp.]